MSGTNGNPGSVARRERKVLFFPEPGSCGGRLEPGQDLIPEWLGDKLDWHVWPSMSPWALAERARAVCSHVDWPAVWRRAPELFSRRTQHGAPAPEVLWHARDELADHGYRLCFDVELQPVDGELALVIYGAGVLGALTDQAWAAAAPYLTTCASTIREPRQDLPHPGWLRPARPSTGAGKRPLAPGVSLPHGAWRVGDWAHTWWGYYGGALIENCRCPAHQPPTTRGQQPG